METMREELLVGVDYLDAATTLLQRGRNAHPTKGAYEAAELQWWWSIPRSTDTIGQLFWFDDAGSPESSVTVTDFGDGTSAVYEEPTIVVTVMPDATPEWVAHVVGRGLAHVSQNGILAVELEVDRADEVLRDVLFLHGFSVKADGLIGCWLDTGARPAISPLQSGYRLFKRRDSTHRPHHMADPRRPDVEQRLAQTSLYRSDLDLVIYDANGEVSAYGLFWYDSETGTGVVEPMRTEDDHQQRGLGRHILTSGIHLLAEAGAERISINYEPDNPASGPLYLNVGFEPCRRTDVFSGHTTAGGGPITISTHDS